MSTRAVILGAGKGTRLNGQFGDLPKCLLRLGAVTLLERQLTSLRLAGVREITVVTGYEAGRVATTCAGLADVLENARYAETNSLYSLWLARPLLSEGFVVLNGDVLFHPQLLADLLSSRHEDALLVAFRDGASAPFGDEEMKVKVRGGRVVDIAKTLAASDADGENLGLARFSAAGARLLVELMDEIVASGRLREWAPRAFQAFAGRRPLHAVGTRGFPWIEIDFPDDYYRAAREVLPLIDSKSAEDELHARAEQAVITPPLAAVETPAEWRPQTGHV
jgi:L-glutamine-phosphate cytidylyltransferase